MKTIDLVFSNLFADTLFEVTRSLTIPSNHWAPLAGAWLGTGRAVEVLIDYVALT